MRADPRLGEDPKYCDDFEWMMEPFEIRFYTSRHGHGPTGTVRRVSYPAGLVRMGTMLRSVNSAIKYRIELDDFGRIVAITVVTCGKDTLTRIWPLKYVC